MYEPFLVDDEGKPLPVPSGDITGAPIVCVPVSQDWIPTLTGALAFLEKQLSWGAVDNDELDRALANLSTLLSLIQGAVECVEPMVLVHDVIVFQHHAANNVAGGASLAGGYGNIPVSRILRDTTGEAAFNSGVIHIPTGLYQVRAWHVFRHGTAHKSRTRLLYWEDQVPGNFKELLGTSDYSNTDVQSYSRIDDTVFIEGAMPITWDYWVSAAQATNGLGVPSSSGKDEIYGEIVFERLTLA